MIARAPLHVSPIPSDTKRTYLFIGNSGGLRRRSLGDFLLSRIGAFKDSISPYLPSEQWRSPVPSIIGDPLSRPFNTDKWKMLADCRIAVRKKDDYWWLTFDSISPRNRNPAAKFFFSSDRMNREPSNVWEQIRDILSTTWISKFQSGPIKKARLLSVLDQMCHSPKQPRPFSDSVIWQREIQSFLSEWESVETPSNLTDLYFGPREQAGFILNRILTHGGEVGQLRRFWLAVRLAWNTVARAAEYLMRRSKEHAWPLEGAQPWVFLWASLLARVNRIEVRREKFSDLAGCLILARNKYVIHVADRLDDFGSGQVICHELAHLFSGHHPNSSYGMDAKTLDMTRVELFNTQEREADDVASFILHCLAGFHAIGMGIVTDTQLLGVATDSRGSNCLKLLQGHAIGESREMWNAKPSDGREDWSKDRSSLRKKLDAPCG